jgi:hypothetical protein
MRPRGLIRLGATEQQIDCEVPYEPHPEKSGTKNSGSARGLEIHPYWQRSHDVDRSYT